MQDTVIKTRDYHPRIPPAGYKIGVEGENADKSIRQDVHFAAPGTPEGIRKYRKSQTDQPGIRQVHPGLVNDPRPAVTHIYGKKTAESDYAGEVVKAQNLGGLADYANDLKEDRYASHQREPLGKSMNRNYQFPDKFKQEGFEFGQRTIPSGAAKDVLFPMDGEKSDKPDIQNMYIRTHGNYAPGQQKERGYQWPLDKTQHSFGLAEHKVLDGVAKAIHPERQEGTFPETIIVKKTVEDYNAVSKEELGKSKNLGQGQPKVESDHAFGIKNVLGQETWNVAKCLHGEPSAREVEPEADLGNCTKLGSRNIVRCPEDVDRTFGVPTLRKDIPNKKLKSVADHQNYGDELPGIDLLFPKTFLELGITEEDFNILYPKSEIRDIFTKIGISYQVGKFNCIFKKAQELCGGIEDVSVRGFLEAAKMMHHME